ncbi:MAG TPA: glycoside hydrolase family 44 protein [Blastocatellia bacterium]|nr:glycoside hydrolase family 44 protein [Blastocatellia bacterium]
MFVLRLGQNFRIVLMLVLAVSCGAFLFIAHAQNPQAVITIDVAAGRHSISPYVYGLAYAGSALGDLNCPIQRYGGNNTTRYNWQINADNRGSDWYFESIGDSSSVAAERIDSFVSESRAAGAQSMVTIPMIGWVAKLGSGRAKLSSFSIAKYGAQTGNDWQWFPDAGNGVLTSGQNVTGNDPNDANVSADSSFHQGLVQHEVGQWGTAGAGGLRYYLLDNESSIWHATHRDVHPTGATMDEIKSKILDYAGMIKGVDPSSLVVGPEEWGWSGYFFSGYDQQYGSLHGWSNLPDRANHGGWDYLPWMLDQLHQNDIATGKRMLDVFSVHYYPQGGEFGNDTSTAMQLTRNQSTRSLWDPNYVDKSWINDKVQLIPRLKNWVSTYYPGTMTAITEYNWGAEGHINGATTQADILGIFGREGLDFAARWTTPDPSTPTYQAIKMYRNYDGQKSAFGDTSVQDSVANPDDLSSFAAVRTSDGALTIMVINKMLTGQTPVIVNLANFASQGLSQVWQLTSANAITRLSDLPFTGSSFSTTVPPQSITLFVLPAGSAVNQPPSAVLKATPSSGNTPLTVMLDGTGSSDPDGSITAYSWDFGDGSAGSGANVSHVYANAGTYTARLTVTDNSGAQASATTTITANTAPAVLAAPDSLTGSVASRKVTLNWHDNSNNESGFYIERAPKSTGVFARVGQVSANVTTFSETVPRATYLYRVQAFDATSGAVSGYSNQAQIRVR